MKIIVIGDIHNQFNKLNNFIDKKKPDILFIVGDFGYFENSVSSDIIKDGIKYIGFKSIKNIKPNNTKIYWIDGNHESHLELVKYQNGKIHEIEKNIFFCSRGSTITINNYNILFIGGAASIDKNAKTEGVDWFREETISYQDFEKCMIYDKIDIVFSHTCPEYFVKYIKNNNKINDSSTTALNIIFNYYNPKLWFFGHWHKYVENIYHGCNFFGLDHIDSFNGCYFKEIKL